MGCYNLPTSQKIYPRNFDKGEMNTEEQGQHGKGEVIRKDYSFRKTENTKMERL